ncbi:MAG TPA: primosomal protein DnaI [Rhodobacteraceae bacterium]|nr:primosomal protein DnaI [Paracoccaceae bacterium]
MSTFDTGAAPRFSTGFSAPRLSRFVARILEARAARAERLATFRALSRLTEHELDDIGLTRADVNALR